MLVMPKVPVQGATAFPGFESSHCTFSTHPGMVCVEMCLGLPSLQAITAPTAAQQPAGPALSSPGTSCGCAFWLPIPYPSGCRHTQELHREPRSPPFSIPHLHQASSNGAYRSSGALLPASDDNDTHTRSQPTTFQGCSTTAEAPQCGSHGGQPRSKGSWARGQFNSQPFSRKLLLIIGAIHRPHHTV